MAAARSNVATIAISSTDSNEIDLETRRLVGFIMPSTFTGTAITFKVSDDGTTFTALYNSSNSQVSITVAASRAYAFLQDVRAVFSGYRYVQFISGSTETAARTITLITEPV